MYLNIYLNIEEKVLLIISILCIFSLCNSRTGYAKELPLFAANELNIKISQNLCHDFCEDREGFVSRLTKYINEKLDNNLDENDVMINDITKIFAEEDCSSPLALWYNINFSPEESLDLLMGILKCYEEIAVIENNYYKKPIYVTNENNVLDDNDILDDSPDDNEIREKPLNKPNDDGLKQLSYDYYDLMDVYEAWEIEKGSKEVIIAVIDSGVDIDHPDLINIPDDPDTELDEQDNTFVDEEYFKRYLPGISLDPTERTIEMMALYEGEWYTLSSHIKIEELDYVEIDDSYILPKDDILRDISGHGTKVTALIAAHHNNEKGIAGIASGCTILPIKAGYVKTEYAVSNKTGKELDPSYEDYIPIDNLVSAIEYASKNADIINISFGSANRTVLEEDIVNEVSKKCIIVVSAGNLNNENKRYPAAFNNVIGVTAVDKNSYSKIVKSNDAQYGIWIDVAAPGWNIVSFEPKSNDLELCSGTSFAVPFVSGLAALIRSRNPNFTVHNFRQLLELSSTPIDDPLYIQRKLGYGLINMKKALDFLDLNKAIERYLIDEKRIVEVLGKKEWDPEAVTLQGYIGRTPAIPPSPIFPWMRPAFNYYLTGFPYYPAPFTYGINPLHLVTQPDLPLITNPGFTGFGPYYQQPYTLPNNPFQGQYYQGQYSPVLLLPGFSPFPPEAPNFRKQFNQFFPIGPYYYKVFQPQNITNWYPVIQQPYPYGYYTYGQLYPYL